VQDFAVTNCVEFCSWRCNSATVFNVKQQQRTLYGCMTGSSTMHTNTNMMKQDGKDSCVLFDITVT